MQGLPRNGAGPPWVGNGDHLGVLSNKQGEYWGTRLTGPGASVTQLCSRVPCVRFNQLDKSIHISLCCFLLMVGTVGLGSSELCL